MEIALFGKDSTEKLQCIDGSFHCCAYLKKGDRHETCDDTVLACADELNGYALIAVFDGVSGEMYGYAAAEKALKEINAFVARKFGTVKSDEILELAIEEANFKISKGATTASVVLVLANGEYYFANVGDSHIYVVSNGKVKRITEDEKDAVGTSFTKYIAGRNLVVQCLGGLIRKISTGKGRLKKGDFIFAASDGVLDNLFISREAGVVLDISGAEDITEMIKGRKEPKEIVEVVSAEIKRRMLLKEEEINDNSVLVPKSDDVSIALLKY